MVPRESLLDVLGLLLRRRRVILGATAAAAILSIAVALLLPVYYRASTLFLAASADQTNPSKLFPGSSSEVRVYGSGEDIERLLAVAASEEVVGFLVDSFDLYSVYDVDTSRRRAAFDVREELADYYEVERTRYDEIRLSIEDRDPERAAAMANAARDRVDAVVRRLSSASVGTGDRLFVASLREKELRRQVISDSLIALSRRYGIVDVSAQAEAFSMALTELDRGISGDSARLAYYVRERVPGYRDSLALTRLRLAGAMDERTALQRLQARFLRGAPQYQSLAEELEVLSGQTAYDQEQMRRFQLVGQNGGTVLMVLDRAEVPVVKARPVRWLIVVASTALAFLLACFAVLIRESYKDVAWSRYLRD